MDLSQPLPLSVYIRRLERLIEDAEWEGRDAALLRDLLRRARKEEAKGETWHVPF
jgi:hypothetical protein